MESYSNVQDFTETAPSPDLKFEILKHEMGIKEKKSKKNKDINVDW